ncbi:MAG: SGNH/GDSL hydrolase family protein, partial [Acidiferrobacterales bacterium]|nr:SGNH/GDSL hydrolase family protein [Acidiferrobacterales bacterium]
MVIFQFVKLSIYRMALAIVVSFSLTQYPSASFAAEDTSIVVLFGDSISLGWNFAYLAEHGEDRRGNARTMHGQPSIQLSALLNDSARKSIVLNDGWGGTASGPEGEDSQIYSFNNGVSRIANDLVQIKAVYPESDFKDYYVLIIYGTNDAAYGISPSTTGFNIQVIVNAAKAQGYTPVVGTIPPCNGCGFSVPLVNYYVEDAVNKTYSNTSPVYFADHYA